MKPVKLEIEVGQILVNHAWVLQSSRNIALIEIDMASKYAELSATGESMGIPSIFFTANDATLHDNKDSKKYTIVRLPKYEGWSIFCAECSRYTARITMHRVSPNIQSKQR